MLGDHPNKENITKASLLLDRMIAYGQRVSVSPREEGKRLLREAEPILSELKRLALQFENPALLTKMLDELFESLRCLAESRTQFREPRMP